MTSQQRDGATLVALGVLAAAAATVLHEALGHGGACWLSGGHNLVISSVNEDCTVANPWISAAGTLVNLAAGCVFFLWARRVRRSFHLRYLLWVAMMFNWLDAAGYWLFSGAGNVGDWADILASHHPAWLWRTAMSIGGAAAYVFFVWLGVRELRPLLPSALAERVRRARYLMLVPYFTFGAMACIAGVFNPVGAVLIAESAAAASFGGASGLAWGWQFTKGPYFAGAEGEGEGAGLRITDGRATRLGHSRAWIAAGVIVAALYIGILGPGVR